MNSWVVEQIWVAEADAEIETATNVETDDVVDGGGGVDDFVKDESVVFALSEVRIDFFVLRCSPLPVMAKNGDGGCKP
ncbi:hypothetical protein RIF29_23904 [Crotalaria pallida]|uniref:Uncharacterized protein n=1 Tax=Crotalaria pallida TaxID=3830 RepID=A0AAN9EL82_CROPI